MNKIVDMKYINKPQPSIPFDGIKLKTIISHYSEMWADVLYNRHLQYHLKQIKVDILIMNRLVQGYPKKEGERFLSIKSDMIKLRDIVETKVKT